MKSVLKLLVLTIFALQITNCVDLEVVNQWNFLDFNFPSYEYVNAYRPENNLFTGLEVTEEKIIVAMPRLRAGIGATLAWIPRTSPAPGSSPQLEAYPDWSFHPPSVSNATCAAFVSVYRIRSDSCNRLWVLDSGVQTSIDDFQRVCPPKLVLIDLATNQVARTIVFPAEVLKPASLMTNLIVDESTGVCDQSVVYMTDTAAPGIVVYDSAKDSVWRFMHPSMFPDPDFSDHTIQGETFTLMDGIVGLAFSPNRGILYYQPLATDRIFSVPTAVLRKGPLNEGETLAVSLVGRKSSQGLGMAVDPRDDVLYFSPLTETSVASWNPHSNQQKLVAYDAEKLQFLSEIRWAEKDGGTIWALSTRFQKFFRRTVNGNEVNLRIVRFAKNTHPANYHHFANNHLYF